MVFVTGVLPHSPAEKAGIRSGDAILTVNGNEINDVLDYQFYTSEVALSLEVKRGDDTLRIFLGKGEYEDPGMEFCTYLMDDKKRCRNGCMFCFIDQNPKGMRETIYFKDDDERLSFLQGNYVTLTNLTEKEIDRIIKMRLSPVNISVHTTNPELRVKMMKNRFAGEVLSFIPRLNAGGIKINAQLVLCRNINDGAELERSLTDLLSFENLESCACVPAGLTDHREGLHPLTPYDKESALKTLEIINKYGDLSVEKYGMRKVFASDEFYLLSGLPIPGAEYYEDYPQIENGVGMLRSFEDEFLDELEYSDTCSGEKIYIATGKAAYPTIKKLIEKAKADGAKIILVDFHAEATSEKRAMGFYLDGKVSAVFGTHTHVQTSDAQILPKGTAYITDLGMTAAYNSILGIKNEIIIEKFLTKMPIRFVQEEGNVQFNAAIIETDSSKITAKCIQNIYQI